MEGRKGDDIAVEWRRHILTAGHKPLCHIGPPVEKTTLDEALHVRMGNIGVVPRIHGGWRWLWRSKGDGGEAKAIDLGLQRRISEHDRSKWRRWRNGEDKAMVLVCRNVKGEAAIYRMERGEKANCLPRFTRPLRPVTSPPFEDHEHAIFCRTLKGHAG